MKNALILKQLTAKVLNSVCCSLTLTLFVTSVCFGQNNIGNIDDRCKTTNYRSVDGWGEYPVDAGQSTDVHDPRIERKDLTKIYPGDKRTFEATYKILAAHNTTFAQILNQDQNSSDKHKPVVFVIAEPSGDNWKLRDQGFSLGTIPKNAEFVLRIDTYYNSSKTKCYSDIYINGVKKETKTHARVGQNSQMRYGNYHHGNGRAIIRVKNVTWQTTTEYLSGGGGGNTPPSVSVTSPSNNATFALGQTIDLGATALDSDGSVDRVNFKINGSYYSTDNTLPFTGTFTPTTAGTYTISARAFDDKGAATEKSVTITVEEGNDPPSVTVTSPANNATFTLGQTIDLSATAADTDGSIDRINFKINGSFHSNDKDSPYTGVFTPTETGTYVIGARAFDDKGASTEKSVTINVVETNNPPAGSFTSPTFNTIETGYTQLYFKVDANDPDNDPMTLTMSINGQELRSESSPPYEWGHQSTNPVTETELLGLTAGIYDFEVKIDDGRGGVTTINKVITVTEPKAPYTGSPVVIPGVLQTENYDKGGSGVSYMDMDEINNGGAYRTDEVDIAELGANNYTIGWTDTGEWLEYTVNVQESGTYDLIFSYSSGATAAGEVGLESDGQELFSGFALPVTGDWNAYETIVKEGVSLSVGIQVLRLKVDKNGFNLDQIEFEKNIVTAIDGENQPKELLIAFPNPCTSGVVNLNKPASWKVYSPYGVLLDQGEGLQIDMSDYDSGPYFIRVNSEIIELTKL